MYKLIDNQFIGSLPKHLVTHMRALKVFGDALFNHEPKTIYINQMSRGYYLPIRINGKLVQTVNPLTKECQVNNVFIGERVQPGQQILPQGQEEIDL